jgi:hypothetical protein
MNVDSVMLTFVTNHNYSMKCLEFSCTTKAKMEYDRVYE